VASLLNTLILCVLIFSLLLATDSNARWKVVAVAIGSIFVNASVHELIPGVFGALAAVLATVALVGVALVSWCELEPRQALRILAAYFGCSLVLNVFSAFLDGLPA
jgi:hypothetical protein